MLHRLYLKVFIALIAFIAMGIQFAPLVSAQTDAPFRPEQGDPPVASLITISAPDEEGIVTISGAAGSVYPNAHITIRNLYTEALVSTQAGVTGIFSARLFGDVNTPFWISPATISTPLEDRGAPGSLPGGPGTIIYAPFADTADTRFRVSGSQIEDGVPFHIGGVLGNGASFWTGEGQISAVTLDRGEPWIWSAELNVRLLAGDSAFDLPPDARLIGRWSLLPIVQLDAANGQTRYPMSGFANNGWSSVSLNGLPVDNRVTPRIVLGETFREADGDGGGDIDLPLELTTDIAALGVPNGLYVPVFEGLIEIDGVRESWAQSEAFGVPDAITGGGTTQTRLPFVLNIGGIEDTRLPMALFYDYPSDGSRGLLPEPQSGTYTVPFTLSNRVRFNSPTYILSPFRDGTTTTAITPAVYPLEPYLPNILPNLIDSSAAPLIPFDYDGATMSLRITQPDGSRESLRDVPIRQAALSTSAYDERTLFGAQSPVDMFRLTTLDPAIMRYTFDQYGEYEFELTADLEDRWGNRYAGGGIYRVTIAEPLDMNPVVLPGTPFQVGDWLQAGVNLSPGVPADVTVTITAYDISGASIDRQAMRGQANEYGVFMPRDDAFQFTERGMVVIDYEARFTDADGRLWAASQRSASIIAGAGGRETQPTIAHGERGTRDVAGVLISEPRRAWFSDDAGILNFPYFSGDVAWVTDRDGDASIDGGMWGVIRAQDRAGNLTAVLLEDIADNGTGTSLDFGRMIALDEVPVNQHNNAPRGYTLITAARPGLTARQFIAGGDFYGDPQYDNLPMWWDSDDPLNGQIGAGISGDRPGDYTFLFGGLLVNEPSYEVAETAIYAALAATIDQNDPRGERVYPPLNGAANGGDGGALVSIDERDFDSFFVPTAILPGAILTVGDTLSIAGQVAPTLNALVEVTVTDPNGVERGWQARTNDIGYFYQRGDDFTVEQVGVWTVNIRVVQDGLTSAGMVEPPYPVGGILKEDGDSYFVYVLPLNADPLDSTVQASDTFIPTGVPYNFTFTAPREWTETNAYTTVTMPGYIIADTPVNVSGRTFSYQFTPSLIRGSFPNFENEPRASGNAVVDPLTLTFVVTGLDTEGVQRIRARQYTLFYNRLLSGYRLTTPDSE